MIAALAFVCAVVSARASMADCGDDIAGVRVPCTCGDIVVTDTRLEPGDPVVTEACATDGLIVRAVRGARGVVLDLNGLTLHGQGRGVGVLVLFGGEEGASIVGGPAGEEAAITGFQEAVRSSRTRALKSATGIHVGQALRSGVRVHGARRSQPTLDLYGEDVAPVGSSHKSRRPVREW